MKKTDLSSAKRQISLHGRYSKDFNHSQETEIRDSLPDRKFNRFNCPAVYNKPSKINHATTTRARSYSSSAYGLQTSQRVWKGSATKRQRRSQISRQLFGLNKNVRYVGRTKEVRPLPPFPPSAASSREMQRQGDESVTSERGTLVNVSVVRLLLSG